MQQIPTELTAIRISYLDSINDIDDVIDNSANPQTFSNGIIWRTIWRTIFSYRFGELDINYITSIDYKINNKKYYMINYISLVKSYDNALDIIEDVKIKSDLFISSNYVTGLVSFKLFNYKDDVILNIYKNLMKIFTSNKCTSDLSIFFGHIKLDLSIKNFSYNKSITKEHALSFLTYMHFKWDRFH